MSDHETTLLSEAKRFGRLAEQFIGSAPRGGQARRAERDAAVEALRAAEKLLIQVVEERRLAGADALRREDTLRGIVESGIVRYKQNGGCSNCGGTPHTATCLVGRLELWLAAPTEPTR